MNPPASRKQISKKWVHYILQENMRMKSNSSTIPEVTIKEFKVGQGTKPGEGYQSELVTLDIIASHNTDDQQILPDVEYHYMIKFFSKEVHSRETNKRYNSHLKEHAIYTEIIKDLNNFQAAITGDKFPIHIPDLIYGKANKTEFILVMENIKTTGYTTNDKYEGLDYEKLKEAIVQIARLHAISYAYDKSHNILQTYPFLEENNEMLVVYECFCIMVLDYMRELFSINKELKYLAKKVEISKDRILMKLKECLRSSENHHVPNCIIHGDCWSGNFMFKNEEKLTCMDTDRADEPRCRVVDWGNTGWGSPIKDLQYLIYVSTTVETRKEHLESILQLYYDTYVDITTRMNVLVPDWSYNSFHREWKNQSVYGFCIGLILNTLTLSKLHPWVYNNQPSVLDNTMCFPTRMLIEGLKLGMYKLMVPIMSKPSAVKHLSGMYKMSFKTTKEELLSGKNKALNKRLIDLFQEADEKGLLD
ncbi:hypothetical protein SK128_018728 [Halocaridina rubra]|uniref:CHK kinase-like domain-containing protein n=1 Tax=Halocaridina rubra TaxID=373956 RepID=A0AAN8X5P4_HALRR